MNEDILDQLVLQLLASLELDAYVTADAEDADWPLSASIRIHGTADVDLEVRLTHDAAVRLSGLITGLTADDVRADPELSQDLANEIANVIAGNLRPVMPGSTSLGLPRPGHARGGAGVTRTYAIDDARALLVRLLDVKD